MDIEQLIEASLGREDISVILATEIMNYGIAEIMRAGATYNEALTIIERAELALHKELQTLVSFGMNEEE